MSKKKNKAIPIPGFDPAQLSAEELAEVKAIVETELRRRSQRTLTNGHRRGYNSVMPNATLSDELPMILGRKIAEKRQEAGLSQDELAARAKVSRVTVNRIEKGHDQPRHTTLARVVGVFGMTVSEILVGV